jgi:hypothetical protein
MQPAFPLQDIMMFVIASFTFVCNFSSTSGVQTTFYFVVERITELMTESHVELHDADGAVFAAVVGVVGVFEEVVDTTGNFSQ